MNIQKISPLRFEILRPVSNLIPTHNRITPNTLPSTRVLIDLRSWTWRRWSNFVKRMCLASAIPQRKSGRTLELSVLEDRATPGSAFDLLFGFDKPDFVAPSTTAFQSPKLISESGRRSGVDLPGLDTPSGNLANVTRPAPRQVVEEASGSKKSPGLDDLIIPLSIQDAFPLTGWQISGGGNVPSDSMELANNHPFLTAVPLGTSIVDFGNSNSGFNDPLAGAPGAAYSATSPVPGPAARRRLHVRPVPAAERDHRPYGRRVFDHKRPGARDTFRNGHRQHHRRRFRRGRLHDVHDLHVRTHDHLGHARRRVAVLRRIVPLHVRRDHDAGNERRGNGSPVGHVGVLDWRERNGSVERLRADRRPDGPRNGLL